MDHPTMFEPYQAAPDICVLPSFFPVPGLGIVPVNAFVLKAAEPVLVDTGLPGLSDQFMANLAAVIDLADLRWLWLTHCHHDHTGSLQRVLAAAPQVRVITTFLGVGVMSVFQPLPMDRVYLLNPGQSMSLGDRTITAVKPPTYDSPEATGFYDPKAMAFFSADAFGALVAEPLLDAADMRPEDLRDGLIRWTTIDSPWLHMVDRAAFGRTLDGIRRMAPKIILSAHLPVARGMTEKLLEHLAAVPAAAPFVGPDQKALEAMLRGMAGR